MPMDNAGENLMARKIANDTHAWPSWSRDTPTTERPLGIAMICLRCDMDSSDVLLNSWACEPELLRAGEKLEIHVRAVPR